MRRPRRAPPLDPSAPCEIAATSAASGRLTRRSGGRVTTDYRARWEAEVGPLPPGVQLHHVCGASACRALAHLEPVTASEHAARHKAARTHCSNGHERVPENRMARRDGRDECLVCNRIATRERRRRARARAA